MRNVFTLAVILAALAAPVSAAEFNAVSAKQAIRAIVAAGYSGVGGVTRNDPYYFAAAISPEGKRVRVAVDVRSGAIAQVTPLPRGAGALSPTSPPAAGGFDQPRIEAQAVPGRSYVPPRTQVIKPIGVPSYPWNASRTKPAPLWCRSNGFAPGC